MATDSAAALVFWIAILGLLAYGAYLTDGPYDDVDIVNDTPPVINIYDSDVDIVSDSGEVPSIAPTTIATQIQTREGPVAVARVQTVPGECTAVCTTACPTEVIPGVCPVGTICCR